MLSGIDLCAKVITQKIQPEWCFLWIERYHYLKRFRLNISIYFSQNKNVNKCWIVYSSVLVSNQGALELFMWLFSSRKKEICMLVDGIFDCCSLQKLHNEKEERVQMGIG